MPRSQRRAGARCIRSATAAPAGSIRTTEEIVSSLKTICGRNNHSIPLAQPIEIEEKDLSINPYVLGAWLGDGTSKDGAITSADFEIIDKEAFDEEEIGDDYYIIEKKDFFTC